MAVEGLEAKNLNLRETIPEAPGREDGVSLPPRLMRHRSSWGGGGGEIL